MPDFMYNAESNTLDSWSISRATSLNLRSRKVIDAIRGLFGFGVAFGIGVSGIVLEFIRC